MNRIDETLIYLNTVKTLKIHSTANATASITYRILILNVKKSLVEKSNEKQNTNLFQLNKPHFRNHGTFLSGNQFLFYSFINQNHFHAFH